MLLALSVLAFFAFGYKGLKAFRLYLKYRDISKDMQQHGTALLEALREEGIITTREANVEAFS